MANVIKTVLTYQLDGSNRDFNIPFEYLARKFVVVTLIGVDRKVLTINTDYRFATRTTISLTKAWGPADGYTTIELRRVTSTTDRLVDFTDGSILRAYDLNVAQIQTMHVAEEARDLTADTIGVNNDGHLDARGRRIVNLANAVDDRDAVPLGQLKTMNQNSWQARNEALQFRNEAETFRNQAEGFKNESSNNATNTNQWRNEAEWFRNEAEQFKNTSGQYAASAGSSAGNAKDSEDEARRIAASIKAVSLNGYITRRSFEKGFNVTTWNEALLWEEDGDYYRWDGMLPKNVPAGSTPESSGGIGQGAWVSVGAASLRTALSSPAGSTLVGYRYKSEDSASVRNVADVLDERVSLWDFHCDSSGNVIQPGPTVDSRQYIQNAIDAIYEAGGGTLIIPTGTWYLNSYGVPDKISNYGGVIHWRSRVNIHFEAGSTLKLTNYFNERGYCVICGFDGNDPATSGDLRDAMITGNGTIHCGDNIQAVGGSLAYAIGTGRSYNVSIRDIHITGGDLTWAVTLGWNGYGSNTVVDGVTVTEVKKTEVVRNVDQSLFYVGCQFSGVQNCYMRPSESGLAAKISAAVELHQSGTFCLNNQMYGLMRGVFVVLHGHETAGSGLFMNNIRVSGNTAFINGQFVTVGADPIGFNTHISDVIVSDNICTIMNPVDSAPLVRCFIASDLFIGATPDNNTARILVQGNSFFAPTTVPDSEFFFFRVSTRGFYFSNNLCDCRRLISGDGAGTSTVELRDIVWDNTNVIGTTWLNARGGNANMIELYVASVLRCTFEIAMPYPDSSIANMFYTPDATIITFSVIKVSPENIPSTVVAVSTSTVNKHSISNYFEFPVTTEFSSFDSSGPVACFSTSTDYAWCGSATALSKSGLTGLVTPGEYGVKYNGQLYGVGYSDLADVNNWSQRVLLKSNVA